MANGKSSDDLVQQGAQFTQQRNNREPLLVVTSIKPLGLIAKDVLGELANVEVLVPATSTPHNYTMKMSDARKLAKADKVIWLGGNLEQFLVKTIKGLPSKQVITINVQEALVSDDDGGDHNAKTPIKSNHYHQSYQHQGKDHHHHNHQDLHIWLDPNLAQEIAEKIGNAVISELQQQGFENESAKVSERLKQVLANYKELDKQLASKFEPLQSIGFIVYHRAYDFLVERYDLRQIGYVSESPEIPIGVKQRAELGETVKQQKSIGPVNCLFVERLHQSKSAKEVAQQLDVQLQAVDILGSSNNVNTYSELMLNVAEEMSACLNRYVNKE